AGTTGYEVAYLLNGLFVFSHSECSFNKLYRGFLGHEQNFDELLYHCKKLIIRSTLASELTVLANLASGIAQNDRYTRDFTNYGLRAALAEVVACFPVYRTYITRQRISEEDRRHVHWAIAQAKKRSPAADIQIFDFIQNLLTLNRLSEYNSRLQHQVTQFALRFQQYTSPVMAKGMEDTSFYAYNRLVSLNDVGFNPRAFGISIKAFHHENQQRLSHWPHNMVTTSTHDSKRGEDVRARINVLSEIPREWRLHLARWSRINRRKKRLIDDDGAPSRNDEYLLYQILLGTWPLAPFDAVNDKAGFIAYRERIEAYLLKAIKEAKMHTSWINPNTEYEDAMRHFVHALLDTPERSAFLADFIPFQKRVVRYGLLNSLSQTLLKLTIPGVPDIYQGNELWSFNLVDPDNRRPVDYNQRQALLQSMIKRCESDGNLPGFWQELFKTIEDSRAKLYLTWKINQLRNENVELFSDGNYTGLATEGPKADHICAFSRHSDDKEIIVVATRWFAHLVGELDVSPISSALWEKTRIQQSGSQINRIYHNILTDETVQAVQVDNDYWLNASDLFRHFPLALLISKNN
ncbi:MAG: malto-oligosyltrehalose synthase, partial [Nitrosomonas sp.]|nr:malto-oligosyltrehalose synthase [Nitrosomonas sp.]